MSCQGASDSDDGLVLVADQPAKSVCRPGSCVGVSLTSADTTGMLSDLLLRSWQFSMFPGISRAEVPLMCPGLVGTAYPDSEGRGWQLSLDPCGDRAQLLRAVGSFFVSIRRD